MGLYQADTTAATYACGDSAYRYTFVVLVSCGTVLLAALALVLWRRQQQQLVAPLPSPPKSNEVDAEVRRLTYLAACVVLVSLMAVAVMLPLFLTSKSPYACQFLSGASLSGKVSDWQDVYSFFLAPSPTAVPRELTFQPHS